jgi:high-affinity nickel-transport protein
MTAFWSILVLGFFLGMRHATDSDHVIAVTTIVTRQRRISEAALTGIFWGVGHGLALLVGGGGIILFGLVIPERVGMSLEVCVALMLILLGVINLHAFTQVRAANAHVHPHRHGDYVHTHAHGHAPGEHGHAEDAVPPARLDRCFGRSRLYQALRPVVIGIAHGLAGSAAVALLVLPIIREPFWAIAYLVIFGVGTIAGMMVITAALAVPVAVSARRFEFLSQWIAVGAGALSFCFGVLMVYQIGFAGSLFTR